MVERLFPGPRAASLVDPSSRINYELWGVEHTISNKWAYVSFEYDANQKSCYMVYLESKRKGEGRRVVKEMVARLGSGVMVSAAIINDETIEGLEELGEVKNAIANGEKIIITDRKILRQLKIVRVLEGGGINTDRVEVGAPTADEVEAELKLDVNYYGHT